jgi:hypothetical protein
MGLPVEVNNLMMGSLGGYTVGRSLRFRASASAYLNRTFTTPTNNKIWTWSGWLKRGLANSYQEIISAGSNNTVFMINKDQSDGLHYYEFNGSTLTTNLITTPVFRDFSAWYHIMLCVDTTQATASNRVKIYVNGSQITTFSTATYPSQNSNTYWNSAIANYIGVEVPNSRYFDGYMAEINFIDGQQLTPSSFGAYDTNGVWQPKKYTSTYGTNGFYLPFSNTTSTTTLVQDSSGNGNNWTPNNISLTAGTTYDSMIDSPTVGPLASNYATWNPIFPFGNQTLTNGNLSVATGTTGGSIATISVSSGKWYWEVSPTTISAGTPRVAGLVQAITAPTSLTSKSIYLQNDGKYSINGAAAVTYGGAITTSDIVGVALDVGAQTVTFYKNGSAMGSAISISSVYTSGDLVVPAIVQSGAANNAQAINFGQRPFSYTPPTGFNALNTYNLPAPSIEAGNKHFDISLWTGTSISSARTITGLNFQPNLVWSKARNRAYSNQLWDIVRGTGKELNSNSTAAETTNNQYGYVSAFNSDGFTASPGSTDNGFFNESGATYAAWQWKAGGTGVTNNSGTITSTVSANPTAGFSIVTWTGNGSAGATVGHGLGVTPSMVFIKNRSSGTANWIGWHTSVSQAVQTSSVITLNTFTNAIYLNLTLASQTYTFDAQINGNTNNLVAYCFAAVDGYSAFGKYTGNGSTDGPFIYTGFRPRFILIKNATAVNNWGIIDTSRDTYNGAYQRQHPNLTVVDNTGAGIVIDVLSNGFKCRNSDALENQSGQTMIYAAFAEHPFRQSRAR